MSLEYNSKLNAVLSEWKYQMEQNAVLELKLVEKNLEVDDLENEIQDLHRQMVLNESSLSAAASVMATLLWKASDCPKIREPVLKAKTKLNKLFDYFTERLGSYNDLGQLLQSPNEQDVELITSLSGFLVNIAAARQGCKLLDDESAESSNNLIITIMKLLQHMHEIDTESETQEHQKAIFLMILYNISLEPQGHQLLKERKEFIQALCKDFLRDICIGTKILEARIIHSLLSQNDVDTFKIISEILSCEQLVQFSKQVGADKEFATLMKSIVVCCRSIREMVELAEKLQGSSLEDVMDNDSEQSVDETFTDDLMLESCRGCV